MTTNLHENSLLEVRDLSVHFPERGGGKHTVVSHVSFEIPEGAVLGIVGESGSGKSMTALSVMGLLPEGAQVDGGSILFEGKDLLKLEEEELEHLRGNDLSMVFQEPMTSLDPVMKIGQQAGEVLRLHTDLSEDDIEKRVLEAMRKVNLEEPEKLIRRYPHELSGGQRQRVMIAQAMLCQPRLLIADEITTALDVVVQKQILGLLERLHQENGVTILFISHDLAVIRSICTHVLVMYKGQIVERGRTEEVLEHPQHEYTKTLVSRIPDYQSPPSSELLVRAEHVTIRYDDRKTSASRHRYKEVVHDLSLTMNEGRILGLVGESGSGKSTFAKVLVGLNPLYEGKVWVKPGTEPQMVFQDPYGSLNPARTVEWMMKEAVRAGCRAKGETYSRQAAKRRSVQMLHEVGLDETFLRRYPRELSGGQRQRISIALSLLRGTRLLVADEPVSALDVTVQSQILKLLIRLHEKEHISILLITHDLAIVRHMCDDVAVMYQGRIVEQGPAEDVYEHPQNPYTQRLLEASLYTG